MSLLTSPYAWGINGRPLLSLLLEVSYQPDWSTFVTEDKDGKKLLGTLERSLIRLLGDGSIFEATLVRGNGLFSIVASLQLILSVLLNTLAAYPALPPRSPQSVAHTTRCFSTTLSRVSADLATLYGQHPSVIRSPEEGWTDLGKNLSVIWTDLNVVFAILVDGTTEKARSLKEAREVKSRWRSRKYLIAPLAKLQELEGERQAIMV
ncbi:hypothetical protein FRB97_006879 [Tulasnella sp. 331]|nr:hypothetical protein FRB97_006879 [Tulasnella sp. 331]